MRLKYSEKRKSELRKYKSPQNLRKRAVIFLNFFVLTGRSITEGGGGRSKVTPEELELSLWDSLALSFSFSSSFLSCGVSSWSENPPRSSSSSTENPSPAAPPKRVLLPLSPTKTPSSLNMPLCCCKKTLLKGSMSVAVAVSLAT
jgi:hypothetical protein